ncbi:MAG: carboxypeptidase-like regulatory domain-containing protein, partial [Bacteroidales bacterium]|nr:carboxypeptidase-like regulatory domain-containing protein [Bacteroidales bacterium]
MRIKLPSAIRGKDSSRARTAVCSLLLLFACVAHATAHDVQLQSPITVYASNSTIEAVITSIERDYNYVFAYNESLKKDLKTRVSIDSKDRSIEEVMATLLAGTNVSYKISGRQISLYRTESAGRATPDPKKQAPQGSDYKITVQGIVTDNLTKEPLIGAAITVKGMSTGTVSDADGHFSVDIPYANAILVVSYVGYQPKEIHVAGETYIEVSMTEDTKALEEVITVGYTRQRKETLTGAVATITTRDLVQSPTANINNALAGRLPGLIANQYSGGEPGVDKAEIFIRGKATFNDQSPIVIVDGVERDMSYLSADEIETFTILKDASATAQYGIRGANGVVIINTKRGQANERAMVNF